MVRGVSLPQKVMDSVGSGVGPIFTVDEFPKKASVLAKGDDGGFWHPVRCHTEPNLSQKVVAQTLPANRVFNVTTLMDIVLDWLSGTAITDTVLGDTRLAKVAKIADPLSLLIGCFIAHRPRHAHYLKRKPRR